MALHQEATQRVPNFNFPSELSDKLWKSMRMTPKKLVCEKEFYERILVAPQQTRTVWECVSQLDNVRSAKASKVKVKGKAKVGSSPPSSPGQASTSASKSRKAKLLAEAATKSVPPVTKADDEDLSNQKQPSTSGSGTVPFEDSAHDKGIVRDCDGAGKSYEVDALCDGLEWGGSGRRRELGSANGGKGKSSLGKRKSAGSSMEGISMLGEVQDESRSQEPLRIKLRKVDSTAGSSPSGASDKSSKEHCGITRRDSARFRNEVEGGYSSMEISDQALALKLHYAMNPRPSRRRSSKLSGELLLDSPKLSSQQHKTSETPESSL